MELKKYQSDKPGETATTQERVVRLGLCRV